MQVLVLAVQNAVDYDVLGAATSGVTMFRGIGGSLGTAVFGAIFTARFTAELRADRRAARCADRPRRPPHRRAARAPARSGAAHYEHAFVNALQPVFLAAAGVAGLGFALSWLLQERPLRETAATSHRPGRQPRRAALARLAGRDRALARTRRRPASAPALPQRAWPSAHGVALSPGATWALVRIEEHGLARSARAGVREKACPPDRIAAVVTSCAGAA